MVGVERGKEKRLSWLGLRENRKEVELIEVEGC